ncbi:M16 family metallopeptidase [Brevundimonas sp.]|uniref:M16 family metallopeptidase n=1 Tax=Brevundimonas sp. TaxID=1871086 RepID=UPI003D0CF832
MSRSQSIARLCLSASLGALMMSAACAPIANSAITVAPVRAADPTPVVNPPVVFAQTRSDLAADPAARFGRLDNGVGYILYRNGTPPGTASVWMRIQAGSIMEQENQRGLAHFIEHMAFQGTTHVAEGGMVRLLERDGLQFGADTNASTSFFETVYMLNLPTVADPVVDHALFLMRETAGEITFDPDAIDRERGVVLSEERARASVAMRAFTAELEQLLPDAKYPERMPIGLVDVLRTAQRPAFVQFYNDFYRPEYTTLIVVGDVDLDRVEAEIRDRFSSWRPGPQSSNALTDFGSATPPTQPQAKVFIAEGLNDTISATWVRPPDDGVETRETSFHDALFAIATTILNERYGRQANAPETAFAGANFQRQGIPRTASLNALNISPKPGQDRAAFEQAMATLRAYLADGPTQDELERVLLNAERAYTEGVASAATTQTQVIAGRIVETLAQQRVLQSPSQTLAEIKSWMPRITLAVIRSELARINPADAPLLWRQGRSAGSFDEAAMLEAYRTAMSVPVTTIATRQSEVWPYTTFGTPTAVVSRESLPDVDATRVTFANGVVLTVKQTDFENDAIYVTVKVGNGITGVRPDQAATLFMARRLGLGAGGLGQISGDDIAEALAGKTYGLGFSIGDDATTLSGATTQADLDVQMQVLTAFMTDPGFRPDALDRLKLGLPASYDAGRASPDGVYALMARGDLYSDNPLFSTPSQEEALAVTNDDISALIKEQLGHGPVEITIVGDITVEDAIQQVAPTLGSLPPSTMAVAEHGADRLRFPTGNLHEVYTHSGRADQNLSVIAWPTTDFYADPRRATALDLLAAVLTGRELEEVRENQGATYSVSASSIMSEHFPGFGFIITRASVRPELDDAFHEAVSSIVAELKARPVTEDELTRARQPLIDSLRNERNSNGYWLALLSGSLREPRRIATTEARARDLSSVRADEIQALAETYLDMTRALRVQVKPGDHPGTR